MQAVLNATSNEDEYVKEFLISHEKVGPTHLLFSIWQDHDQQVYIIIVYIA